MRSPLQRLYETKLALLATILTVSGLALLALAQAGGEAGSWTDGFPLTDLGSALFTTGLVAVIFEYVDARDSEERASRRLRRILREQAPAIRDAVIDGFAFDARDLARVASPAVLDQVARNALALQLGDQSLAEEVYEDLRTQVLRPEERHRDLRVRVDIAPWTKRRAGGTPLFEVTVRWEYTVVGAGGVRRFTCVSDETEYRELLQEPAGSSVWHFPALDGLDAGSRQAFELTRFTVDDVERPIRRTARSGSGQTYTVTMGCQTVEDGHPHRIAYTYRLLARQHGHLLHFQLGQPTKGVRIEVNYRGCGIRDMRVLDFIASSHRTTVMAALPAPQESMASVSFDGWALPRSGVAFVWTLDGER